MQVINSKTYLISGIVISRHAEGPEILKRKKSSFHVCKVNKDIDKGERGGGTHIYVQYRYLPQ